MSFQMVAGNHSQITLEATYKVTQMLQRKRKKLVSFFIALLVAWNLNCNILFLLQFFLHILTLNSYPKPAADPSYIQIVYHFSQCVVDDDISQAYREYDLRQKGQICEEKTKKVTNERKLVGKIFRQKMIWKPLQKRVREGVYNIL